MKAAIDALGKELKLAKINARDARQAVKHAQGVADKHCKVEAELRSSLDLLERHAIEHNLSR